MRGSHELSQYSEIPVGPRKGSVLWALIPKIAYETKDSLTRWLLVTLPGGLLGEEGNYFPNARFQASYVFIL